MKMMIFGPKTSIKHTDGLNSPRYELASLLARCIAIVIAHIRTGVYTGLKTSERNIGRG